jgi:hypothetical protein
MISTAQGQKKVQPIFQSELTALKNGILQLGEATGPISMIELEMRIIAERNLEIRKLVLGHPNNKKAKDEYWSCKLSILVDALVAFWGLDSTEATVLKNFTTLRNKLVHGEYVSVLSMLGIRPEGREYLSNGEKRLLQEGELLEAAKAVANIGIANEVSQYLVGVNAILEKLKMKSVVNG